MLRTLNTSTDLLTLHKKFPQRYPFLLESVAQGSGQSAYDILFALPQDWLALHASGELRSSDPGIHYGSFLEKFEQWFSARQRPHVNEGIDLPFTGGWFLYLGYELVSEIEPDIRLPHADAEQLVAYAADCPAAIIQDHRNGCVHVFTEDSHAGQMDLLLQDLGMCMQENGTPDRVSEDARQKTVLTVAEEDPERYIAAVKRIRQYIIDGDVFQVNLSRSWQAHTDETIDAADLYRRLRTHNPAPFAGIAQLPGFSIISSSPERLVEVRNGVIQTRPIAGTRPRSGNLQQDRALAEELMAHPKEQAEHIMLIDLERNDLGRVCIPGTVSVDELMTLETYAHVHHIVSNVRGYLRPEASPVDVIRAVFPGGTITGCPKVRCMEIIGELEAQARGAYTGSMGYINRDGSMDFNILIRTMTVDTKTIHLRTGAGIVYDSIPDKELEETRAKARGLLLAIDGALE
jgi:anthranilate synthase component 1